MTDPATTDLQSHSSRPSRVEKAKAELDCPICLETLKEPRTLTCQHTFCTACLQQLADTFRRPATPGGRGVRGEGEISISCPECRANTTIPKSGVRGLTKNFKLERLIHILHASSYEDLTSRKFHKKPSIFCIVHADKPIDYYCTSCDTAACGDCLLADHHNHEGVKHLTDILEHCSLALKGLIPEGNKALKQGEISLEAIDDHSSMLVQQGTEATQHIEAYFNKIRDLITKRELEVKQEVAEEVELGCMQITNTTLALSTAIEEMKKRIQTLEQAVDDKSPELVLKQEQLKCDFKSSQRQLDSICETAAEIQTRSIKPVRLEDTRFEVLCRTLAARAPTPLPRKRHKSLPSPSGIKSKGANATLVPPIIQVEEALDEQEAPSESDNLNPNLTRSRSYSFINEPRDQDKRETFSEDDSRSSTPLPSPPAPINTSVVIEPALIWGQKQLINECFQHVSESVYPRGVCCGVSGTLVVTDIQNHCIRIVASMGKCIGVIGREGREDGQFGEPTAVTTDLDGNLLVCDLQPGRLQKFSPDGKFITKFSRMFLGNPLGEPWGVAVNHDGKIFVSDWDKSCIHMYNEKGRYVGTFGSTENKTNLKYPAGIAIDKRGRIIVADRGSHVVCVYSPDGKLLTRFGKTGCAPGELCFPFGVAVNRDDNNILISESGNHRISVFDAHGNFLRCFGMKGTAPGHFNFPRHICIDGDGRLVVSDEQNQRIQIFTSY